jgi:hypothetical protein
MRHSGVLVLSTDPLAAALIGAAAELTGFEPIFPLEQESPRDALLRTRPRIVLVDCDHDGACNEAFFGPALMAGASLAVFSSSLSRRALEPIAVEFGVRVFRLPMDVQALGRLLSDVAAGSTA